MPNSHARSDPRRGVEPGKPVHGPDESLGREIGDRLRLATPAGEIAHQDIHVAQVHLLEFLKR